jgi:RNA polymerase sigma-70 factor (ECF subfamily)
MPEDDAEARAAVETTDDSFGALVPPMSGTLVRVAAALVGIDEAEDAAQEAILRSWQAWPTLRDKGALRPWLLQITVNVCRAWQRGRFGTDRRNKAPLPRESDVMPAALQTHGPGAWEHAAELDLRQALLDLPEETRLIVALRYFGGLDASEIGPALGISPVTVRTRLHRALRQLRSRLRTSGELPALVSSGDKGDDVVPATKW